MPIFAIPCKWEVETIEKVEGATLYEAESKALMLNGPGTLEGCRVVAPVAPVDYKRMSAMYPVKEEPGPMVDWDCVSEPGAYEGGCWEKKIGDYKAEVVGDTGPIEVGFSWTSYEWSVYREGQDFLLKSRSSFRSIEEARDAALEKINQISGI